MFFATSAGVASFDPVSLVWTQHPDAGAGSAGALVFSPPGRVWAGSNDAGQGRVAEYNPSLGVPLVAPADRARRVTDASGLQTLTLEWAEAAGATGYEVFLNGAPLGRTTATSREVLLGAGEYTWTVRALYGDTAGPRSVPFRFSVGEGRQQQDLEFLLVHQTAQGHTRVLDVFQTRGTGIWSTFLIDPRFRESQMNASVDLAATSDARLASVSFDGVSALPEQYPTRLLSSVQARPSPSAWRVDATSEPGGLVLSGIPSQDYFVLYNSLKGERQVSGARATDVAGLTRGRFAVLDAAEPLVRVYQRDDPGAAVNPLAEIRLGAGVGPQAITGLPDGGFALLTFTSGAPQGEVAFYDASYVPRPSIPITGDAASAGTAIDLAADEEGRIFVLLSAASPRVFFTRDVGPAPAWTEALLQLPAGATNFAAIASYATPRLAEQSGVPDAPPPIPTGTIVLDDGGFFVYAPSGFSCAQPSSGTVWILGFLRTDASLACDSPDGPASLAGTGKLYLDYSADGYGSLPAGFPGAIELARRAVQHQPQRRQYHAGERDHARSGLARPRERVPAEHPGHGRIRRRHPAQGYRPRPTAFSGSTFGAFHQALQFSSLLLTDVGGTYHQTFGGVAGLLSPYDQGPDPVLRRAGQVSNDGRPPSRRLSARCSSTGSPGRHPLGAPDGVPSSPPGALSGVCIDGERRELRRERDELPRALRLLDSRRVDRDERRRRRHRDHSGGPARPSS